MIRQQTARRARLGRSEHTERLLADAQEQLDRWKAEEAGLSVEGWRARHAGDRTPTTISQPEALP